MTVKNHNNNQVSKKNYEKNFLFAQKRTISEKHTKKQRRHKKELTDEITSRSDTREYKWERKKKQDRNIGQRQINWILFLSKSRILYNFIHFKFLFSNFAPVLKFGFLGTRVQEKINWLANRFSFHITQWGKKTKSTII